jgi:tetratricopeptide (TPR) repeat protein
MRLLASVVIIFGVIQLPQARAEDDTKNDALTRSIMHSLFDPISKVLPLSLDEKAFKSAEHKTEITELLKQLRDHAAVLEVHGKRKDRGFEYVAKSFKNDAKNIYRWYTHGDYDEAQFTLRNITDNCITCHSSLPESHRFPPAESFFKAVHVNALSPLARASYYVMSRQFDQALTSYEAYFKQSDVAPANLVAQGAFIDYLKICINVKQDLARPRHLIDSISRRPHVSGTTSAQLKRWSATLVELEKRGTVRKTGLAEARKVLNDGRSQMEYLRDRDGIIHYLVASAILNRYVHDHPDHGQDVAEAYYLLGITESLLGHSFWLSRSEFYLESAIRLAPNAPFAAKAFDLLEQSYTASFSGSGGTHIPDDINNLLAELQRIMKTPPSNVE